MKVCVPGAGCVPPQSMSRLPSQEAILCETLTGVCSSSHRRFAQVNGIDMSLNFNQLLNLFFITTFCLLSDIFYMCVHVCTGAHED